MQFIKYAVDNKRLINEFSSATLTEVYGLLLPYFHVFANIARNDERYEKISHNNAQEKFLHCLLYSC